MATINFRGSWIAKGVHQTVWPNMGNADSGIAQSGGALSDKSVQATGTWGGATLVLQGSNDGTTWFTLNDPAGTDISFTANGLMQILEGVRYIRPVTSGGAGTDVTVVLIERGGQI